MWAPPNEGVTGGAGEFQDDTSQQFQQDYSGFSEDELNNESQLGGEITVEDDDPLASLFAPPEPDPNNPLQEESEDDGLPPLPTQQELTQRLQQDIEGMSIPEDIFPENYDPNDQRSQRELYTNISKHVMQHTIRAMFTPVQVAMQQMQRQVNREIRQSISGNNSAQQESQILESVIPAIRDPGLAPVVKQLFDVAKTKHKDPRQAAQAAKRGLEAMGVNPNGRPQLRNAGQRNPLDDYARLPEVPDTNQRQRPSQRTQQMLRR